jgi:hypothetical protein
MIAPIRIAAPVRFILAMFRLIAGVEEGIGRAILQILKKQYPNADITDNASSIGHRMMAVARRELQYNQHDAMDLVQDFLMYITTGSQYETDKGGKVLFDKEGDPIPRKDPKPFDFTKGSSTWKEALDNMFTNLRHRAITKSMSRFHKKDVYIWTSKSEEMGKTPGKKVDLDSSIPEEKAELDKLIADGMVKATSKQTRKEKTVDQAFGKRSETSDVPEGGESRIPTPTDSPFSRALDEQAAIKQFMTVIGDQIPEMRSQMNNAQKLLFDLIFYDEEGGFGSDIQDNMGQASEFKKKLEQMAAPDSKSPDADTARELLERYGKRWSGFVGDTRNSLLEFIEKYINDKNKFPAADLEKFQDMFYSDIDPVKQVYLQEEKGQERVDYQRGLDLRKMLRARQKGIADKSISNLEIKLKKEIREELEQKAKEALEGTVDEQITPALNEASRELTEIKDWGEKTPGEEAQAKKKYQDILKKYNESKKKWKRVTDAEVAAELESQLEMERMKGGLNEPEAVKSAASRLVACMVKSAWAD